MPEISLVDWAFIAFFFFFYFPSSFNLPCFWKSGAKSNQLVFSQTSPQYAWSRSFCSCVELLGSEGQICSIALLTSSTLCHRSAWWNARQLFHNILWSQKQTHQNKPTNVTKILHLGLVSPFMCIKMKPVITADDSCSAFLKEVAYQGQLIKKPKCWTCPKIFAIYLTCGLERELVTVVTPASW